MNKLLSVILVGCWVVTSLYSCKDYDSSLPEGGSGFTEFDGSILDYLAAGDKQLNVKFDSMLLLINGIPGMRDTLEKVGEEYTVFAVPDECFQGSLKKLNHYRSSYSLGKSLCLDSLLIPPFTVIDTIIEHEIGDRDTLTSDYNYLGNMENLLCRYIFEGDYSSEKLSLNTGGLAVDCFKYNYGMNLLFVRQPASGAMDGGIRRLYLYDMNNSRLEEKWAKSSTQWFDIRTRNGIVHVLSSSHEFGFDDFVSFFYNVGNERKKNK